ncbi:glycosyltransferase family A protein, partial [Acidianus sp. RZ1]|uniref:glycosyltransferase family A protein n=1 Tax=Acidianus sp. RZ1 TaxID=1540082 RepID=UPI001492EF3F
MYTVAIPTFKNNGTTIVDLLNSLTRQTFSRFKTLIVYKDSPEDKTIKVIEKFRDKLDLEIIEQKDGYIEEALNLIFSNFEGDILMTTDDDAVLPNNWIESHIKVHEKYPWAGVIGSLGHGYNKSRFFMRLYNSLLESPLDKGMREYVNYFSKSGILVRNSSFTGGKEIVKTFN